MAAVDYFLKIEGVDGESADSKHKGEIDVDSWSWGETQNGTMAFGGGGGAGKVQMQDFHFVMKVNKATPKLIIACATGEHIKKAVLTCRKAGKDQQEFLKYTFSDVLVSSYQTGGAASGSIIPTDQIALNYAKMEIEYKEQKADGNMGGPIKVGYDLKAMKKI
ncbi:MAG TPA: type VI secretion system tube protein Hcp [Blastocatellia bacterium]|jgi:type VI secretion system secreted protein Hcp|nr:type VI secretion system tube protein Hcp [Blastocatellia bacterium]